MNTENSLEINTKKLLMAYQSKQFEEAKSIAITMTKEFPNYNLSWKILAAIYAQFGDSQNSIKSSDNAIKIDPSDAEAYSNMGLILFQFKKFKDALKSCQKAIEIKPDNVEAHFNLGNILKALGKLTEAEKSYLNSLKLNSKLIAAHFNLASTYIQLNKLNEAETSYKKIIELKPDYAEVYSNMGTLYLKLKRENEAELSYKKAIELNPNFTDAHLNMGVMFQKLNRPDEAESSYRKAIELKPDFAEAYLKLGILMQKLNRSNEAELNYQKALKIKPNYVDAQKNIHILMKEKKLIKIVKNKKKTQSLFTNEPFKSNRLIETDLIKNLYEINSTNLDDVDPGYLRYGNGSSSDYNLFDNDIPIIKNVANDLTNLIKKAVGSEIFIMESFFNIFKTGSGIVKHNHINYFDRNNNLISNKFSLVYYLSVGDQSGNEPGILKLYDPEIEILPTDGMIMIFPADRMHTAVYSGKTDRVMIGINFYSI